MSVSYVIYDRKTGEIFGFCTVDTKEDFIAHKVPAGYGKKIITHQERTRYAHATDKATGKLKVKYDEMSSGFRPKDQP